MRSSKSGCVRSVAREWRDRAARAVRGCSTATVPSESVATAWESSAIEVKADRSLHRTDLTELNLEGVADLLSGANFAGLRGLRKLHLELVRAPSVFSPDSYEPNFKPIHDLVTRSGPTLDHLTLSSARLTHLDCLACAVESADLPKLVTLGLTNEGVEAEGVAASIVNHCKTIETLALVSSDLDFHGDVLKALDPSIKLHQLSLGFGNSLWDATQSLTEWLDLPALESVKLLKIGGAKHRDWRDYKGGATVVELAKAQGIKKVVLRWDERRAQA